MQKYFICILLLLTLLYSCREYGLEPIATNKSLLPVPRLNKYSEEIMKSVYLWADDIRDRYPDPELDPKIFFSKLIYEKEDNLSWSHIDDRYTAPNASTEGFENGFGYRLSFYYGLNTSFALINFVYPGSPADRAGLKRGDLVLRVNNMTVIGLWELHYNNTVRLEVGTLNTDGSITPRAGSVSLTAERFETNPIIKATVIRQYGKTIGYLHYAEYVNNERNSLNDLSSVFAGFRQEGVNEFILDLRYNPGGYLSSANYLCSHLAPWSAVSNSSLLISKHWNKETTRKLSGNSKYFEERFNNNTLENNLNLKRIYILTGENTASASELTISGLSSYMPVITIGEKTNGKYVGSVTYVPDDKELSNWAVHPIVFSYLNARNESVKGGISPTYPMSETPEKMKALGDPAEPMLKAALDLIAGKPFIAQTTRSHPLFKRILTDEETARMTLVETPLPKE